MTWTNNGSYCGIKIVKPAGDPFLIVSDEAKRLIERLKGTSPSQVWARQFLASRGCLAQTRKGR